MTTNQPYLKPLLSLRLLIGYLGEQSQFSWWPTKFYESTGPLFLEPAFPKTWRLAQYHGVVEAAQRLHDEHLSVGSYHLFRLPEEVEQDLHRLLLSTEGHEIAAQRPTDRDSGLVALNLITGGRAKSSEGPTAVGGIKEINSPVTLKSIAEAYLWAFQRNLRSYPYLVV